MRSDRAEITALARRAKRVLITSHINPDGDSIAAQLALARLFERLGAAAVIVNRHPVPRVYGFLPGADGILVRQRHPVRGYDALFVLDCGHPSRASGFLRTKKSLPVVNIDHHVSNAGYGDLNWVDTRASSTSELVYELARHLGVEPDGAMAECLYAGILTDTGSFRYSSTTPRALAIAGRLLRLGVDPQRVAIAIYDSEKFSTMRLLGEVLAGMRRTRDGKITWISIPHRLMNRFASPAESEEFVAYPRSVITAVMTIAFKELRPRDVRLSFRSKGDLDVSAFASRYGGGGHRNAAGCMIAGRLPDVERSVVAAARRFLAAHERTAGTTKGGA